MKVIEDRLRDLLVRGLAGDASSYHAFLKELSTHLRAFLKRRLSRLPDEVEDLVQETLLAVHNQRHTYDAGQPLTAWVHAIARYKLIDLLRRRAGCDALNDPLDDELAIFAESATEAADAGSTGTPPRRSRKWSPPAHPPSPTQSAGAGRSRSGGRRTDQCYSWRRSKCGGAS